MRQSLDQAIHIFRKDVRRLRYEIAVAFALAGVFTALNLHEAKGWWLDQTMGGLSSPFQSLLALGWAYLLALVIQSEALPGDRQFWLTRPYSRTSLLISKFLFAMVFVNLPMLISDIVTLSANGFPPTSHIAGLAWKQILLTMIIVLPPFALASATRGLGELILTSLGLAIVIMFTSSFMYGFMYGKVTYGWSNADRWIEGARLYGSIAAVAIAVIALQYFRRATALSRGIAISSFLLVAFTYTLPASPTERAMEPGYTKAIEDTSWLHVEPRYCENCAGSAHSTDDFQQILMPIDVTGIPDGTSVEIGIVTGYAISPETRRVIYNTGQSSTAGQHRYIPVNVAYYPDIRNQPITLNLNVHFEIYKHHRVGPVAMNQTFFAVPGIGYCAELSGRLVCRAPLRWPRAMITVRMGAADRNFNQLFSASPFPGDSPITAVSTYASGMSSGSISDGRAMFLDFDEPSATASRLIEWKNIRLADFEGRALEK